MVLFRGTLWPGIPLSLKVMSMLQQSFNMHTSLLLKRDPLTSQTFSQVSTRKSVQDVGTVVTKLQEIEMFVHSVSCGA